MIAHLIRHGTCPANEERRYAGRRTDEPLSKTGRAQCREVGPIPGVRRVLCSPLRRALETATLVFPEADVVGVAGLEEFDFGAFEGRSAQEMARDVAYRSWVEGGCTTTCPGGESRASFDARTLSALQGLVACAQAAGEREVVVCCHAGTIMCALAHLYEGKLADGTDAYFSHHVAPLEGYTCKVEVTGSGARIEEATRVTRDGWATHIGGRP